MGTRGIKWAKFYEWTGRTFDKSLFASMFDYAAIYTTADHNLCSAAMRSGHTSNLSALLCNNNIYSADCYTKNFHLFVYFCVLATMHIGFFLGPGLLILLYVDNTSYPSTCSFTTSGKPWRFTVINTLKMLSNMFYALLFKSFECEDCLVIVAI